MSFKLHPRHLTIPHSYGNGTVFCLSTSGSSGGTLASLNRAYWSPPKAGLLLSGSKLYGTTAAFQNGTNGTIFSVPVTGGAPTVLAAFNGTNGSSPSALIVSGNTLYGTTMSGGANNDGTIFSLPVGGGNITTLATFNSTSGFHPVSGLVLAGGTLYGTAAEGGACGDGTVFSLPMTGGNVTTLATFNGTNGSWPMCVILAAGTLYGTAGGGGNLALHGGLGDGTVFAVPVSGGNITTLDTFDGTNGAGPNGGLVMDSSGNLYGTTEGDGVDNMGTVFSVPSTGGVLSVLASFNGTNGSDVFNGLCMDTSGGLYGTTLGGGTYDYGTVFSLVDPAPVPEPATVVLLSLGGVGLLARRRKK